MCNVVASLNVCSKQQSGQATSKQQGHQVQLVQPICFQQYYRRLL